MQNFYQTRGGRQFIDGTVPNLVKSLNDLNKTLSTAFISDGEASEKENDLYHFVLETLSTWDGVGSKQGAIPFDEAMKSMRHVLRTLRALGFHRGPNSAG